MASFGRLSAFTGSHYSGSGIPLLSTYSGHQEVCRDNQNIPEVNEM